MAILERNGSILRLGVIFLVALVTFGAYFVSYKPLLKKIQTLKEQVKAKEGQLSETRLKLQNYVLVPEEERLLWAQAEEQILTVISNKKHLYLLAGEIVSLAPSLEIADISYLNLNSPTGAISPAAANPSNPAASTQAQTQAQALSQPEATQSASTAYIDHMFLRMKFYCTYGELLDFLKNLNQLRRLIAIEALNIKKAMPKILVEITFRVYYWEA